MNNFQKGFAWAPALLVIVGLVVVGGGAYYVMHKPVSQDGATNQKSNATDTLAYKFLKMSYEGTTDSSILAINIDPSALGNIPSKSLDVTGWTLKSTKTGKSYVITAVQKESTQDGKGAPIVYKDISPLHVTFVQDDEIEIYIAAEGSPAKNNVFYGMSTSFFLNTGTDFPSYPHDSLELIDTARNVAATYSY